MKPYSDADIVKERMLDSGNELLENKKSIVDNIRGFALSTSSTTKVGKLGFF